MGSLNKKWTSLEKVWTIKEAEKNLDELEKSLLSLKKYYDYDDVEYRGLRDIENYLTELHSIKFSKTITS